MSRLAALFAVMLLLAGCAGGGGGRPASDADVRSDGGASGSGASGRYALSGDAYPQDPPDVTEVPDAEPRREARSRGGNRSPYEVWGETYEVLSDPSGYVREGHASWYGEKFHGYATSNGEIYDMYKMSAAHRSLPLPSFVRVTSLDSDRSVIVRVNDRGPFHGDREIDLSYAAAARLDLLDSGTGRVRVEAIDVDRWLAENADDGKARPPEEAPQPVEPSTTDRVTAPAREAADAAAADTEGGLFLQVAALGSAEGARTLQARLEDEISRPVRVASDAGTHRVQVGPLSHAGQVEPIRDALRRAGFDQAFIVNGAQ